MQFICTRCSVAPGVMVTELGEAKGTTLAHELEKVLMSKLGHDQDRIRDEFKNKGPCLAGTDTYYV